MPTYEYECKSCGYRFEKFQSIAAEPLKSCPKCRKRVRRLIGAGSGIIFKGSGFYATDYRKSGNKERGDSKKDSDGCPSAGSKPACPACPGSQKR